MKLSGVSVATSNQVSSSSITIKPLKSEDEFGRCQEILIEVWDLQNGGQRNIIPTRLFKVTDHCGGVVLGAHNPEGEIIGFAWAFPALDADGKLFLFSDTLAVLPEYRDQGIGSRLKFAQRDWALQHNVSLIRWTYDPLEARNGFLNIARLGGLACTYLRNEYGIGTTGPNKAIETDRLISDWYLNSERVKNCAGARRTAIAPPDLRFCLLARGRDGELIPCDIRLDLDEPELLMPLPLDFQRLKDKDLSLAKEWRVAVRTVCESYFARGYAIVDFHVEYREGERNGYYRIARNWVESLASIH